MNEYKQLLQAIEEGNVLCSKCIEAIDRGVLDAYRVVVHTMEHFCLKEVLSGAVQCSCPCFESSQ